MANNGKRGPTGGGGTDVRYSSDTLNARIMVAGGGAGSGTGTGYGNAGGLIGYDGSATSYTYYASVGKGATQISGGAIPTKDSSAISNGTAGAFGQGGTGGASGADVETSGGAGGGGGYYGGSGASGLSNGTFGAGGGSSYISGHTGCVAIMSENSTTPKSGCTTGTTDNTCSVHYSGKVFTDTLMIDGNGYKWITSKGSLQQMPNISGGYYESGVGNLGNGAARISKITVKIDVRNGSTYGTLPTPTHEGYTFSGWNTMSDGSGETITSSTIVNLSKDQTLYAIWTLDTYTISYNANGGSGAPESQTKEHGTTLTLSTTTPTRSGYNFLGWSTSSTATSATYSAGGNYTINESVTLYAVWQTAIIYLYNAGNEYTDITGGWQSRGWKAQSSISYNAYGPRITKNSTYMAIWMYWHNLGGNVLVSGVAEIAKDFDFTDVSTLTLDYSVSGSMMIGRFVVVNRNATYASDNAVKNVQLFGAGGDVTKSRTTATLDVSSLSGEYDVAILLYSNWVADGNATVNVYSVYAK